VCCFSPAQLHITKEGGGDYFLQYEKILLKSLFFSFFLFFLFGETVKKNQN